MTQFKLHPRDFRKTFRAKLGRLFLVPSNSFDNVKGHFPIGFHIWDTSICEPFETIAAHAYDTKGTYLGTKTLYCNDGSKYISDWIRMYYDKANKPICFLMIKGTDIQNQNSIYISNWVRPNDIKKHMFVNITSKNVLPTAVYTAVRRVIPATWLNDRDQFLYPNDGWKTDLEFQSDCLAYTLFNNNIQAAQGTNHWIPFTEQEVDAKEAFKSHFMSDYIRGKSRAGLKKSQPVQQSLFADITIMGGAKCSKLIKPNLHRY